MRIEDALNQVRVIQLQAAGAERYCCYRWASVAATGVIAVIAVVLQPVWVPVPALHPEAFVAWWVSVALLNMVIVGTEMYARWLRSDSEFARRQTVLALQQFAPCLIAGGLLTVAILVGAREHASLIPALWSVLFSLGMFASWRFLPPQMLFASGYYLAAGVLCMLWSLGDHALQPWTMLLTFGAGQLITSFVLYRYRERLHGSW
jgi:hypothetical protein